MGRRCLPCLALPCLEVSMPSLITTVSVSLVRILVARPGDASSDLRRERSAAGAAGAAGSRIPAASTGSNSSAASTTGDAGAAAIRCSSPSRDTWRLYFGKNRANACTVQLQWQSRECTLCGSCRARRIAPHFFEPKPAIAVGGCLQHRWPSTGCLNGALDSSRLHAAQDARVQR